MLHKQQNKFMSVKTIHTISVISLVIAISVIFLHNTQSVQATPQRVIDSGRNLVNMARDNWTFVAGIVAVVIGVVWMANSQK